MDISREIVWEYIGYTYDSLVLTKLRIDLKLLFGVFDTIREVFIQTIEAKTRGYKAGQFSFNVKGGRCEACSGQGVNIIEMNFIPDVYIQCDVCKGERYNRETLQVKYKGKSLA
jgi:excinuclease ABC subunit A